MYCLRTTRKNCLITEVFQMSRNCEESSLLVWFLHRHRPPISASEPCFARKVGCCIAWLCTSYIIVHHTAVHSPNHRIHLTDFEPDWMSLKPSNLGSQAAVWVPALCPGGNMFSGWRSLGSCIDSPQPAGEDGAGPSVARLRRGHQSKPMVTCRLHEVRVTGTRHTWHKCMICPGLLLL